MSTFGKSKGGGRRKGLRTPTPLLAVIATLGYERRVGVVNVSNRGVQLTSPDLPPEGEIVMFQSATVEALGQVVWCGAAQCGVLFDESLSTKQVDRLRREANIAADTPYLTFGFGQAA